MTQPSAVGCRWMSVEQAAGVLGISMLTLRRNLERNAVRKLGGVIEASFDGVRGRRFGRRWRVALDATWITPSPR